ncbi:insulin receptor substrate-like protein, partial [Euroglyphus maynei]
MPATNSSTSSQSPVNSRERLHSCSSSTGGGGGGSVRSHTASDCSNEDLSQGYCASSNSASSVATTPLGPMFPPPWNLHHMYHPHGIPHHYPPLLPTSHHNHPHQCTPSQSSFYLNNSFAQSSSSCGGGVGLHNPANQITNNPTNSSTSSLSTELDIQEQQPQFQQIHATMFAPPNSLDLHQNQPGNLVINQDNREKGFSADLDLYPAYIPPLSSQSTSSTTIPACTSCIQMCYLQLLQQQHLSSSGQPTHHSPITSPKCHCSACLMHSFTHESSSSISSSLSSSNTNCCISNVGQSISQNHHYLPTIPAGEPSDYVPMKPMNAQSQDDNSKTDDKSGNDDILKKNSNKTGGDDDDDNCYLHMSPLAVANVDGSNPMVISTSNSVSNSIEFHLEKSRYRNDDHTAVAAAPPKITPVNMNESNDDTIFNGLTRAYSTGSKPQPLAPLLGSQCNNQPNVSTKTNTEVSKQQQQLFTSSSSSTSSSATTTSHPIRTRASSTGSHGMKFRAFLSSRRRNKMSATIPAQQQLQHGNYQFPSSMEAPSSSCCSLIEEQPTNKSNKAASAPILS